MPNSQEAMGKKRLIERKIVDDEKIGYTRICMLRAFLGLGPRGGDSGGEGEPATEKADTGLRGSKTNPKDFQKEGKLATETANTGLPDSETNPELPIGGPELAKVIVNAIKEIEESVKQGQLTWEEVYLLFEKIFTTLEAKLKTTCEEAIFGFRKSLGALRKKIAEISANLSREVFGKITGSKMFKQLIMTFFKSIIVGGLAFSPITTSSAHAKGSNYKGYGPAYATILDSPNSGSAYSFFIDRSGVSNFNFPDADSAQVYDPEGGSENGEVKEFNLEQALNSLKEYPTILNNTLLQIIDKINEKLLQEEDKQPPITGLKIVKDGNSIVELSGPTNFSEGVYKFDPEKGTFELYAQIGNHEYDMDHTGGVVVVDTPYTLKYKEGIKQYTSGAFTFQGHCCGKTSNFAVFEKLGDSGGGIVEIKAGGKVYKFDIKAVGVFDAQASMDILSFDYQKVEEYLAKLLGLYDGTNPQWKQTLSRQKLDELNRLIESFLAGRSIFLMTCDENSLYAGSDGQLHSTGRVVAVATLQPDQEPPFMKPLFALPVEFVPGQGAIIRIKNEEDWKIIQRLFENLHQAYPQIVEELLQAAIEEAQQFEVAQPPNSQNPIDYSPTPQPQAEGSSPSAVNQTDPGSVDSGLPSQTEELQTEATFAQEINHLNEELSKAGLAEILPTIRFVGETDVIDLQALVGRIKSSNQDLPSLITHFLLNRHHLGLLGDYIQVLGQLAVGAPDGDYKQNLNDFAYELKLVELFVGRVLPAGTFIIIISAIIGILRFLLLKRRS